MHLKDSIVCCVCLCVYCEILACSRRGIIFFHEMTHNNEDYGNDDVVLIVVKYFSRRYFRNIKPRWDIVRSRGSS
jgi:hypothetical protein